MNELDLFGSPTVKAKNEEHRPKLPIDTSTVPTAAPKPLPKKRREVAGHDDERAYVQTNGGRVMRLDRVSVKIVLEDPFEDVGRYPIELDLADFFASWDTAAPEYVASEYARLGVKPSLAAVPSVDDGLLVALNAAANRLQLWIASQLNAGGNDGR